MTKTRQETLLDYEGFVEKFQPKKTTDDCYTPPPVYDAVVDFVGRHVCDLTGKNIVRPFYPGGDYKRYDYQPQDVVIDNPPFSILTKITRDYTEWDIPFFLFAPSLTLFEMLKIPKVTAVVASAKLIYENGANVNTSFITNMYPDSPLFVADGRLHRLLSDVNRQCHSKRKVERKAKIYPPQLVTSARLHKMVQHLPDWEWRVPRESGMMVRRLDGMGSKGIFGKGVLLSERATVEKIAAEAEVYKKIAAEEIAETFRLSEREKLIVSHLK